MLEWSPPRLLAVVALTFLAILSCLGRPTSAKPYPQERSGYEHLAGGYQKLSEEFSAGITNSNNGYSRDRRSPAEDHDFPTGDYTARKRHGIETPIQPLETKSDESTTPNEGNMASLRSKVDQPESSNIAESSADDKTSVNGKVPLSNGENQNKGSEAETVTRQTAEQKRDSSDEKENIDRTQQTTVQQQANTQTIHDQHGTATQNSAEDASKKGLVNDNSDPDKIATTQNSVTTSSERGKIPSDRDTVDAGKINADSSSGSKAVRESPSNFPAASGNEGSQTSPEPIRDKLGTSGSEIVTTHRPYEERMPNHRDLELKEMSSEPEVGHFQVDDKSADLEINANSAGVKVKAKPASLQVVSRPGSHSASTDAPLARSFYDHYHYPPFHRLHPWLPSFRNPLRRHHLYRPYRFYPRDWFPAHHRYDYDPEYLDASLYRRRPWFHHRRHSRYHKPYLYERSRTEEPVRRSRFHFDGPWGRRYRRRFHRSRAPFRRRLYDRFGIPVMNNFASTNMNVPPEADTLPQLPFNPQVAGQMLLPPAQRQNIVTPMPPPINLIGNPPPSIMNGANLMGMNGMNNLGTMSTLNGLGAVSGYSGLSGLTGMNSVGAGALDDMNGLTGGLGEEMPDMEGTRGSRRHVEGSLPDSGGRPVKKAAIQSSKADVKNNKGQPGTKRKLDLKGWEKILKHHSHDHKTSVETNHRSRRAAKLAKHDEVNSAKQGIHNLHPEKSKDEKGSRKNAVIIHRPPIIYHPPPEIYHRPAIVVHRAPIMLHRSPIIYHQPPVVVHRPAIIYHQPPIVFHQPPPVVNQPIMHSHDAYVTRPVVYHTNSLVSHAHTYFGVPANVYSGAFGCHGPHCAFRKADVPSTKKNNKPVKKQKRSIENQFEFIASDEGAQEQLTYHSREDASRSKRDRLWDYYSFSRHKRQTRSKRNSDSDIPRKKKKDVVVNRPPIIYHPPPEIYHRPDIVVHRPPLVIHRPPIIYHQPPVIVHRPAVVYHQPPIVFHQPPPAVSQPLLYSHDSFVVHPTMYASHHGSVVRDAGHYVGMPNVISNYGHPLFGMPHFPMGKRSIDETERNSTVSGDVQAKTRSKKAKKTRTIHHQPKNETSERAGKKNSVMIARPPIIYHPPPEVYHRPVIVVHRAPIMLHRAPIIYHQPPVIVHRPAIVYHQPPLVFHQPPPVVNQPILHSHDTWIRRPIAIPYSSHVSHHSTYLGVPDSFSTHMFGHYHGHIGHGHAFYKSNVARTGRPVQEQATPKDKIEKLADSSASGKSHSNSHTKHSLKRVKSHNEKGKKKNAVIVKRPPVIYHPPPEIYHRPVIIIHRAPIMLHRAPIIYHQPPVIVHRPAVVYHQPSLIFHQPPPVVHQVLMKSHDTWVPKPAVTLYSSRIHHAGHMFHIPNAYFYHGHGAIHSLGYGKSKVPQKSQLVEEDSDARGTIKKRKLKRKRPKHNHTGRKKHITLTLSKVKTETGAKLHMQQKSEAEQGKYFYHKEKEKTESGAKKNAVIIHRPPIIYHPPPEVYHRPNIVVHRAPIVLYRAPIIYHQPPVVVHRPAIVYHQPPIVFHQPPPAVHQPIMHSHDTYVAKSVAVPYSTHVHHVMTYHGVPHEGVYMHGFGSGAFAKSQVPPKKRRRNKIAQQHKAKSQKKNEDASTGNDSRGKVRRSRVVRSVPTAPRAAWHFGWRHHTRRALNDSQPASEDHDDKADGVKLNKRKTVPGHKKKKDVVVNRPPIIYHPPPEVYHRPDIVVHRAPILIHRPPIVYHQPPVVVHRPAVVYHQPPIVFHQPSPAVNQPILYSHDSFAVHPMAFASHMGSVINDAGHYVGLPHGGINNYPAPLPFASPLSPRVSRRGKVEKPADYVKPSHKRSRKTKETQTGGAKKNKVIVARPQMVYHPPAEIYDRPDIIVHRPDLVFHRPSVVYHQPSVVVHRPPVIYQQPPVVFHQPSPMTSQPIVEATDIYAPHPAFVPHATQMQQLSTYFGTPHFFPGFNNFGWQMNGNMPGWHAQMGNPVGYPGFGNGPGFVPVFGRSNVEGDTKTNKSLKKGKNEKSNGPADAKRSSTNQSNEHGHHAHLRQRHFGGDIDEKESPKQKSTIHHRAHHRSHVLVVNNPPVVYQPPAEVIQPPPVVVPQSPVVYHRPTLVYHQPPTVVHHPAVVYHQPSLVLHSAPSLIEEPQPVLAPLVPGPAFGKSKVQKSPKTSVKKDKADTLRRNKRDVSDPRPHHHDDVVLKSSTIKSKTINSGSDRSQRSTQTHTTSHVSAHARPDNTEKSHRKNKVIMLRPPMIYHPPVEIYDRPDIIVHRPDYVVHQSSVVYHQPSVVVHRPAVVYQQPPVVFHQPPPMVNQPVLHAHDTYVAHHVPVPYASHVQNTATYLGAPHFFPGRWNFGWQTAPGFAYGKSEVPEHPDEKAKKTKHHNKKFKRDDKTQQTKNKKENGHKKNRVIMHRPPLIYHPPVEIYHRPSIIVHRPDLVIHRPSIVFDQPSVVVHRPPVIYHQPPVVFHQPPPMVHQPMLHAHDTYLAHPDFVPYWSHLHHASTYVGAPHSFHGGWGWGYGHGFAHPFGKSKVEKAASDDKKADKKNRTAARSRQRRSPATERKRPTFPSSHAAVRKETAKGRPGHKKNMVVMHRPPLIYHPPPEIYHRPSVVVHRPDLVIHRPSVVFHQPPVIVHRPSVVYHQPPIVFHQPPPMVHQPLFHSHETYLAHPFFSPVLSHLEHAGTYVGAPHLFPGGWGWGHAFGKSQVAKGSKNHSDKGKADATSRKNRKERSADELEASGTDSNHSEAVADKSISTKQRKTHDSASKKHERKAHRKNLVVVRRPEMVYHPPAEIYDRPDIVVHRPDLVYHQPSIVYHQPPVVVHRPPITYTQPPVVFHQPAPMVNQPVLHQNDQYYARPEFSPYMSQVQGASSFVGSPPFYSGNWGFGWNPGFGWNGMSPWGLVAWKNFNGFPVGFGPEQLQEGPALAKSEIAKTDRDTKAAKNSLPHKSDKKYNQKKRHLRKLLGNSAKATTKTTINPGSHTKLKKEFSRGRAGHKKNLVIMRRPPLVYHPPAEVYHRPVVVVHRPDIVIHRPSVVFHQPSVVVHRPPVVYRQPPVVFHQPPPMVHQPILHSHETYLAQPDFQPFTSHLHHAGSYVGAPHFFHGGWGWGWSHGFGHAFGRSHVQRKHKRIEQKNQHKKDEIMGRRGSRETSENPSKKNSVVVSRPPIIYHPPPEIYHRPDIVVHRAPIVLHRPPIIYHQPPVVVHRPAVVYHQPPIIFHQPLPAIHQPILHSHDSFVVHPEAHFIPQGSTVSHAMNYVGIPSSVLQPDELAGHFHRSQIEHGQKHDKEDTGVTDGTKKVIKSAISRNLATHKENTETAITDEAQKKTLRSDISHTEKKSVQRNVISSHSPVTPFNDVHPAVATIEQHQKLSSIPGNRQHREKDLAKRSSGVKRKKRQALVPLPNMYRYAQNALEPHPTAQGFASMPLIQSPLVSPFSTKEDSPEVHVHVETAKSSIPRVRRQLMPVYPVPRLFTSSTPLLYSGLHAAAQPGSSPLPVLYHPPQPGYFPYPSTDEHRPRVSISVNTGGSRVVKRDAKRRTKRQLWGLRSPMPSLLPISPQNYFPQAGALPPYVVGYGFNPSPYYQQSTLGHVGYNGLWSYLNALYAALWGYPSYHQRPKVNVDVHTSRSKIQKAKKTSNSTSAATAELRKSHPDNTRQHKTRQHHSGSHLALSTRNKTSRTKRSAKTEKRKDLNDIRSELSRNKKRDETQDNVLSNAVEEGSQLQDDRIAPEQTLPGQFVGGSSSVVPLNAQPAANYPGEALSEMDDAATANRESFTEQGDAVPQEAMNQWQRPEGRTILPPQRLPLQTVVNSIPVLPGSFPPVSPNLIPGQFQVMRAPLPFSLPSFPGGILPMQFAPVASLPQPIPLESDQTPGHTSVNVEVAKSSVPNKKRNHHTTAKLHKKETEHTSGAKRQKITLLNRLSTMQILPQTFKQNGVNVPLFRKLPINNYIGENGMLATELEAKQRNNRKHRIPGNKGVSPAKRHYKILSRLHKRGKHPKRNRKNYSREGRRKFIVPDQSNGILLEQGATQSSLVDNSVNGDVLTVLPNIQQHVEATDAFEGSLPARLPLEQPVQLLQSAPPVPSVVPQSFLPSPELQSLSPVHHPRVSIHIETAKKTLPNRSKRVKTGKLITKRQMFGTVPLLSPVSQLDVHNGIEQQSRARSIINQSSQTHPGTKRRFSTTDPKRAKRQFIQYLAGKTNTKPLQRAVLDNSERKAKRQLPLMQLGEPLERRGSPKPLGAIFKKPPGNGRLLFNPNFNSKPIEVFGTPPNIPGIPQEKPKFQDPPIMADQVPLKGAAPAGGFPMPAEIGPSPMFQDSQDAVPLRPQQPIELESLSKPLSAGITEPGMAAVPPPAIKVLEPELSEAGSRRGGLSQLLLAPRVLPVPSLLPVPVPFEEQPQVPESAHLPVQAPPTPLFLPPFLPIPPPEMPGLNQPLGDTAGQGMDDERPSVHVNVETSKSHIPNKKGYLKHKSTHTKKDKPKI